MTYSFVNISSSKFSINGRTLYKTFIPLFIDNNHIKIVNVYDSKLPLISSTHVSEIEVDATTYNNATDLINAIHDVLFSRTVTGDVNNEQIELNRLAIIDLQNNKSDTTHNHDSRYYTKSQVDSMIQSVVSNSDLIDRGEVDGDQIKFYDGNNALVFTVDAATFTRQGTLLSFANGILTLKNDKGEILSTASIKAKETYYDVFEVQKNIEDDLNDLIQIERFSLVETVSGDIYFVSQLTNKETLKGARIYLPGADAFFDLDTPSITTANYQAWQLTLNSNPYIEGELYTFNFWNKENGKGVSVDADNSLVLGSDEKPYYKERTPEQLKTAYESNPNTNAFTDAEKNKLATIEESKFKGTYSTVSALNTAYPTAEEGSYAYVDTGVGEDVKLYIWDSNDATWIETGAGTVETPASIKSKYESNPDTNAFTDAEKALVASAVQPADLTWGNITNKPDTATRWPSWNEVTGKPTTFTPSAHNHDDRYYTETESDTMFLRKDVSDTKHGNLIMTSGDLTVSRDNIAKIEIIGLDGFGGIVGTGTDHDLIFRRNNVSKIRIEDTVTYSDQQLKCLGHFYINNNKTYVHEKGDGGTMNSEFEDNYYRLRRSGSGTIYGWRWDNYDVFSMLLTIDGDLTLAGEIKADSDKTVWHEGNDGSGSGLDADKIDGKHVWVGSQAAYDAISTKDSNTLYFIT